MLPASAVDAGEWDAVVRSSPDGWPWALSGWQRLILAVPRWGLVDYSFAVASGDRLAAVVPLQFQPSDKRLGSSGWGLTGPIISGQLDAAARRDLLAEIFEHVNSIAADTGAALVEVGHVGVTATALNDSDDAFAAFGFADESTTTRVIDLRVPEEQLLAGFSKNARQMIKRAEGLGYTVRQGDWAASVDDYYRVHSETYTRTGVSPHPREYFEGIATEMAPRGDAVLWVGAAPDGRDVAFHNDASFGPGALYHTGCSETAHLDSGINYLLMWHAMRGARAAGRSFYELGEVFPEVADGKARGLSVFKSKFGGDDRRFVKARKRITTDAAPASPADTDAQVRSAYERGTLYDVSRICLQVRRDAAEYVERLLADKLDTIAAAYRGGTLVDLCCATGAHAIDLSRHAERVIGVDFSARYLDKGQEQARAEQRDNVTFVQADARSLPLASNSVDTLYCLSSLYAIPRAVEAVKEVGRVLRPGGRAVLDFGNRRSLNAFCLGYYTEWPPVHPMTLAEIRAALRDAGLIEEQRRRFQLLPLWADRPPWLWPLLHPGWKSVLKVRIGGRMLDEWLCRLPVLRGFAFRHLVVCRKGSA